MLSKLLAQRSLMKPGSRKPSELSEGRNIKESATVVPEQISCSLKTWENHVQTFQSAHSPADKVMLAGHTPHNASAVDSHHQE